MSLKVLTTTLLLFLVTGIIFASNADSASNYLLNEKISLLETKVEMMNQTNDKLIFIIWTIIAIVVTFLGVVTGLSIWSNYKVNRRKVDNIKEELKTHLESDLFNKHREKSEADIKRLIESELSSLNKVDTDLHIRIVRIHIQLLLSELGEYVGEYRYEEFDKRLSLLEKQLEVEAYHQQFGRTTYVHDTLESIQKFVKQNPVSVLQRNRMTKILGGLHENYKPYVESIENHIGLD